MSIICGIFALAFRQISGPSARSIADTHLIFLTIWFEEAISESLI